MRDQRQWNPDQCRRGSRIQWIQNLFLKPHLHIFCTIIDCNSESEPSLFLANVRFLPRAAWCFAQALSWQISSLEFFKQFFCLVEDFHVPYMSTKVGKVMFCPTGLSCVCVCEVSRGAWAQNLLKIGVFPWKLHDFEEILGARGAQAPWIRCCRPHTVDQNPGPELVLDVYKCLHKQTWRFHVWKTSVTNAIATLKGSLKSLEIAYKLGKLEVTLKSTWHTFALIRQLGAKAKKNVR